MVNPRVVGNRAWPDKSYQKWIGRKHNSQCKNNNRFYKIAWKTSCQLNTRKVHKFLELCKLQKLSQKEVDHINKLTISWKRDSNQKIPKGKNVWSRVVLYYFFSKPSERILCPSASISRKQKAGIFPYSCSDINVTLILKGDRCY